MVDREPFIVWPAPGLPALVEEDPVRLSLLVAFSDNGGGNIARWAEKISLRSAFGEDSVGVVVETIEPLARNTVDPMVRGFAELPSKRSLSWVRIGVRASAPLRAGPDSPVELYDLMVGNTLARSRSVATFTQPRQRLALAFASDLHLASLWDLIDEAVEQHAPDLAPRMLRPARLLDRFIAETNTLWSHGELDLVVLGGDLMEYVHNRPRGAASTCSGETNAHRVVRALQKLRVPTITIPGNHDYRAFPWRPRTYGLRAIGIPVARTKALLKIIGLWDHWPLRRSDFDALRTADESGNPALAHYLTLLAPATDFSLTLRGTRLVFASTGCDVLSQWPAVERHRWGSLARSLCHCWDHPDSEGLFDDQVAQIASALSSAAGAAVFFHAPLLSVRQGTKIERCLSDLDIGDGDDLASEVAFERRISRGGMRRGVLFRNPGPLVRTLVSAAGPVVTFSGHTHRAGAIELDRRTLAVRSVPLGPPRAPDRTVTLFTAPAVGQLPHDGTEQPGYLLAAFESGKMVSLQQRTFGEQ